MSDPRAKRTPRDALPRATLQPATGTLSASQPPAEAVASTAAAVTEAARTTSDTVRKTGAAASDDLLAYSHQAWTAMSEAQAATARGFEAMLGVFAAFARSEIAAATEGATALLGVRTLSEAVEVHLGYARRSFDALVGSTAKLSEISVKTASDASRPILSRFSEGWKMRRFG